MIKTKTETVRTIVNKIQVVLMREHGYPMTTAEIQNTIKRELLR